MTRADCPTLLSREEARAFYDRFGAKQDQQAFYEDRATHDLRAHADFSGAHAVFELGCGTGRFAAEVLQTLLPDDATYVACDPSTTMVELARTRLAAFGARATVHVTDGSPRINAGDATYDRFVSNYVLDLLSPADIEAVIAEAHRVLRPAGLLCLASLTYGVTPLSRLVTGVWTRIHRWRPGLVGGCRPLQLLDYVSSPGWEIVHRAVVVAFGLSSEVVVARKR